MKSVLKGKPYPKQLRILSPRSPGKRVQEVAEQGVRDSSKPLPHVNRIQEAFGRYDVSGAKAHVGKEATKSATALGATGYTTGRDVAFRKDPDLHTAAHEAAHVVQQQAGVHLDDGVGRSGDPLEQHAETVADAVVQGRSAEPTLARMVPPGRMDGTPGQAVQRFETGDHAEESAQDSPATGTVSGLVDNWDPGVDPGASGPEAESAGGEGPVEFGPKEDVWGPEAESDVSGPKEDIWSPEAEPDSGTGGLLDPLDKGSAAGCLGCDLDTPEGQYDDFVDQGLYQQAIDVVVNSQGLGAKECAGIFFDPGLCLPSKSGDPEPVAGITTGSAGKQQVVWIGVPAFEGGYGVCATGISHELVHVRQRVAGDTSGLYSGVREFEAHGRSAVDNYGSEDDANFQARCALRYWDKINGPPFVFNDLPDARKQELEALHSQVVEVKKRSDAAIQEGYGGGKTVDLPPPSEPWSGQ